MRSIFSFWHFDVVATFLVTLLCFLYFYAVNFHPKKQSLYFFSGVFLLLFCVSSPLHFIGEHYLFSAQMATHVLILLIAAPLIVAGIPLEHKYKKSFQLMSKKIYQAPFMAWICGVGIMWVWHIPYIFNQLLSMHDMAGPANSMNILMSIHLISLLIAGIIFCWPVITPHRQYRIAPLTGVLYLSAACVCCSLLGLIITFAPAETYTKYITTMGGDGYLSMIRSGWQISALMDQQIAGLIMWVPCCLIYLSASMALLINWFNQTDTVLEVKTQAATN